MGRKNRKKTGGFIIPPPLLVFVVAACGFAIGFLWLRGQCERLGDDIKAFEGNRALLRKRLQTEEYKWSNLRSPRAIETALTRHGLDMTWPARHQVVRLYDSEISGDQRYGDLAEAVRYAELERIVLND